MRSETICAISTAPGGAIGIIRVSGSDSISLVDQIFKSATGKKLEFCKALRPIMVKFTIKIVFWIR